MYQNTLPSRSERRRATIALYIPLSFDAMPRGVSWRWYLIPSVCPFDAGQVISDSVVGSLEYAVAVLEVPLIVVLGHDECGAVRAAIDSTDPDAAPLPPHIWRLISPIVPAVRRVQRAATVDGVVPQTIDAEEVGREHLRDTVAELLHSSELISDAVAEGRLAIVGANYRLAEGTAVPDVVVGIAEPA